MDNPEITETQVSEILAGWTGPIDKQGAEAMLRRKVDHDDLIVGKTPAGWLIVGRDHNGVTRAGCRSDPLSLARDLLAASEAEAAQQRLIQDAIAAGDAMTEAAMSATFEPQGSQKAIEAVEAVETVEGAPIAPDTDGAEESQSPPPINHGGMMVEADDLARLRTLAMLRIDNRAAELVEEIAPEAQRKAHIARTAELTNKLMLGLITDLERIEENRLARITTWINRIHDHAADLKRTAAAADLAALQAFDFDDGWPDPPH